MDQEVEDKCIIVDEAARQSLAAADNSKEAARWATGAPREATRLVTQEAKESDFVGTAVMQGEGVGRLRGTSV